MKNLRKNIPTVWAIIILLVLSVIVGAYVHVASMNGWDIANVGENLGSLKDKNSGKNKPGEQSGTTNATGLRAIAEDGFTVTYDASLASEVKLVDTLPDNRTGQYSGTALVPVGRLAQLGERKCYYGDSGVLTECRLEMEDRISVFTAGQSLEDLTAEYEPTQLSAVTVAGTKSVIYRSAAEGRNTEVYFIPIDNNKTAIVKRLYSSTSFPTKAQLDAIIATLKINK